MEKVKADANTLTKKIEYCLLQFPATRDCDVLLLITVWQEFYGIVDTISVVELYELPREDHIKRIRAQFQSSGQYPPTNLKVVKKRRQNEDRRNELMQKQSSLPY